MNSETAKQHIMIIEDEADVRALWVEILSSEKYSVSEHANGEIAFNWWSDNRDSVTAIIMDMMMPVMGGLECLSKIRAAGSNVPCLVTSGFAERNAENLGDFCNVELLQKPFDLMQAAERLKRLIHSSGNE